jgi:hypothetical protein
MRKRSAIVGAVFGTVTVGLAMAAGPVDASGTLLYSCPLTDSSGTSPCTTPSGGTMQGDVTPSSNGYLFNPSGSGAFGYVALTKPSQANLTTPLTMSVQVEGVGVPSTTVGDYDVVRGTPKGNWKIEALARNSRTTARASCFFKGLSGKGAATGGPDLSKLVGWHTITCTDTGSAIKLTVSGSDITTSTKTKSISTGAIPNAGQLLIGAKNTSGGDQFSGSAKDVTVTVG